MNIINWCDYVPGCEVVFSTLSNPDERIDIDDEVAGLILPGNIKISVIWSPADRNYVVNVYYGSMQAPPTFSLDARTPADVIDAVVKASRLLGFGGLVPVSSRSTVAIIPPTARIDDPCLQLVGGY